MEEKNKKYVKSIRTWDYGGQTTTPTRAIFSWARFPPCPLNRSDFVWGKSVQERASCPLSGIGKCPLLGGCKYITAIGISIRATDFDRCREVVRFSEGPLWEVRLYMHYFSKENRASG